MNTLSANISMCSSHSLLWCDLLQARDQDVYETPDPPEMILNYEVCTPVVAVSDPKPTPVWDRFQSLTIDSRVKLYYLCSHVILEVTRRMRSGDETNTPVVVRRKNPSKKC